MAATLLSLVGCGGKKEFVGDAAEASKRSRLAEIHDLVFTYAKSHKQPPKKISDLQPLEKVNPAGLRALKDKTIILIYGVSPDEDSDSILAYEANADKDGGLALLANGDVKKVSADQVKAAAKDKQ